jgi:hypothetical protein
LRDSVFDRGAGEKVFDLRFVPTPIGPYAERMLREFDYDRSETAWSIDARVRSEVRKVLEEELSGRETEQEVGRMVREVMREIEGCR